MASKMLKNPTPGEILLKEFLEPVKLSQSALARAIGVNVGRVNEIVNGKRAVTADTDLRLCRYFRMSNGFFLRLQSSYETEEALRKSGKEIAKIKPLKAA